MKQTAARKDTSINPRAVSISVAAYVLLLGAAVAVLGVPAPPSVARSTGTDPGARARVIDVYGTIPLHFEENRGQADSQVRFLARPGGRTVYLTNREAVFFLPGRAEGNAAAATSASSTNGVLVTGFNAKPALQDAGPPVVRMKLVGANPNTTADGLEPLPGRTHYLIGSDSAQWRVNIPSYGRVRYQEVYPGIDLVYYGNPRQLEFDFVVAPGANPGDIRMGFEGVGDLQIDSSGDLLFGGAPAPVRLKRPFVYQNRGGAQREIKGSYRIAGQQVSFDLAEHDPTLTLVIDPVLVYSTLLGGSGSDMAAGIAVDRNGNAYIAGTTDSPNFPTQSPFQPNRNDGAPCHPPFDNRPERPCPDAFVAKINPQGTRILYSTYLGGQGADLAQAIAVDQQGNAYVLGASGSADFPLVNSFHEPSKHSGMFVLKLNPTGSELIYSTYLGGSGSDSPAGIAIDSLGSAYVTGTTRSADFPVVNPLKATVSERPWPERIADAFVSKLKPDGSGLLYSTYVGGSQTDEAAGIAVDAQGAAYITGRTNSLDFPTVRPSQAKCLAGLPYPGSFGGSYMDAFAVKLTPEGSALEYSTCLGGSGYDQGSGIAVDQERATYITGATSSADFPVVKAFQNSLRSVSNAFITKLSPSGSITYSTHLGGSGADFASAIAVDALAQPVVAGTTYSKDFPLSPDALQRLLRGTFDAFLVKLSQDGGSLIYGSYVGGSSVEQPSGVAVGPLDAAYLTGTTQSTDFPRTQGAARPGSQAAFVVKVDFAVRAGAFITDLTNAASFESGPIAPGEIVSLFGEGIGPNQDAQLRVGAEGVLETKLAETQVLFDEIPAPLIFVSRNQINAIVPYSVAGQTVTSVEVSRGGSRTLPFRMAVTGATPGIFTMDMSGKGPGAVLNQDLTINSPLNPALRGSVVAIFGTGEGQTDPPGVDGLLTAGLPPPKPNVQIFALIDNKTAPVLYAGGAPGLVAGVLQVNVQIPTEARQGPAIPVHIGSFYHGKSQTGVTLAIK